MTRLDRAWEWFQVVSTNLALAASLPGSSREETTLALRELDEVAIIVLFAAFEAEVREHLEGIIRDAKLSATHASTLNWFEQAERELARGGIQSIVGRARLGADKHGRLSARFARLNRYRNWVAHGRRALRPDDRSPDDVYADLADLLRQMIPADDHPTGS